MHLQEEHTVRLEFLHCQNIEQDTCGLHKCSIILSQHPLCSPQSSAGNPWDNTSFQSKYETSLKFSHINTAMCLGVWSSLLVLRHWETSLKTNKICIKSIHSVCPTLSYLYLHTNFIWHFIIIFFIYLNNYFYSLYNKQTINK